MGGPGEAAEIRGSTEGTGDGEGETVGERTGSGDWVVVLERGDGQEEVLVALAETSGIGNGIVGRREGGDVATVRTGGQGGGEGGLVGVNKGGSWHMEGTAATCGTGETEELRGWVSREDAERAGSTSGSA